MLQRRQVENLHRQKAIKKRAQSTIHRVGQADYHHIDQIAVVDLLREQLAHVARQVVILAVDHEEDRDEENYEKIND